jgi:aryl-alcohol dehydrogenase-like predicted oxidoreductase
VKIMEYRRLGKTEHASSIIAFGTVAIGTIPQDEADRAIEYALSRGINHFDVAPSYGEAELRLGSYLKRNPRPDLFVGCKTNQRGKREAGEELHRTLDRLGRDRFDLYQLHAVCNAADLEAAMGPDSALEAILDARDEGLVGHIGITGHGWDAPATHAEALRRFDFSTVMTSCNLFMAQRPAFFNAWRDLMNLCQYKDVGVHVLKATARMAWGEREHTYPTWYEPFTDPADVDRAVAWALNQPVATLCSAGDMSLLPAIIDASEHYVAISETAQLSLLSVPAYGDIFVTMP